MQLKPLLATLALAIPALVTPSMADAAITQVFATRAAFMAAVPGTTALSLALPGAPPVFVTDFTTGNLTISAQDGMLAGDGVDIVSTELDADVLILDFAQPIHGVGLFGGVVDVDFAFVDGSLSVEAVGSGTTLLLAPSVGYLGLLSDVAFTQLRLSVASFDGNITSVGFGALQSRIDRGPSVAAVPEPAAWSLLIAGFTLVGMRRRTRRISVAA